MDPLSPEQAAEIASAVYLVRNLRDIDLYEVSQQFGANGQFSVDAVERFEGTSGAFTRSGFGIVAGGVNSRREEVLIAVRGTATIPDCLTDINIAVETGPSGHLVHGGFHRTFRSFHAQLKASIDQLKPSGVHVVVHSLGGAVATIVADQIHLWDIPVKLYSFGAPRSGLIPQCLHLSQALPAENIFRVFHSADPVTMIPVYPFHHAPISTYGYSIPFSGAINGSAHRMKNYMASVKGVDWRTLRQLQPSGGLKETAESYLNMLEHHHTVVMLSAPYLRLLLEALQCIIKSTGACIGVTVVSAITLLDLLAQVLYHGYLTCKKIGDEVERLLRCILKFMGRPVSDAKEVTVEFISWLLNTLFTIIANMAFRALNLLHPPH